MHLMNKICTLAILISIAAGAHPIDVASQRLFGHSIKNGHLVANTQITLFEHNCTTAPCAITHLHCPTAGPTGWETALFQVYVDGESDPSITVTLAELAHVGRWNVDGNERNYVP